MGNSTLRGCDIFCGAGCGSVGASAAGIRMVGAIDMCPTATTTYAANFPNAHVVTSPLEDVAVGDFMDAVGKVDIMLASPECKNHTCAKGGAPRDEASRATAMHVVEYAHRLKPRWLVLENVIYMRPWSRYKELKGALRDEGYFLREHILDASDFGVAQKRRRLFVVGDRENDPPPTLRKRPGRRKSVKSVLDPRGTWPTSPLRTDRRAKATLIRAQRALEALPADESFLVVYYGSDGCGGWQRLNRPLRTITTVDRFALVEPGESGPTMRMLQVPELKRAMGLPDYFQLPTGTRRDKVRLLGNGVCSPVMEGVVRSLTGN